MTSQIKVNTIKDLGGNTIVSSNGSGTFTSNLPSIGGATGVDFNDGVKVRFGTGNDFELLHNSSTGNLLNLTANPLEMHQVGANSVLQLYRDQGNGVIAQFFGGATEAGSIKTDTVSSSPSLEVNANGSFAVRTNNGTERMRIQSDGKVGIGETAPLGKLHVKSADSGASVSSEADELVIEHGNAIGGMTFLAATDGLTKIAFGDSGNNDAGLITYSHDGTHMGFTVEGSEKMRIQASGNVSINSTSDAQKLFVYGSHVSENGLIKVQTSNGSGTNDLIFFKDGNDHGCGEITLNASANTVAYVTSSDYRLKQNATDIADGITRLKQLKPYRFQWKSDPDNTVDGFFAHEAQEIVPESVKGTKDAMKTAENVVVNADGTVERHDVIKEDWEQGKIDSKYANNSTWEATKEVIDRQGIDQAKLVPLLTAALKEAITKIETLETENTDIKARLTALENA